MEPILFDPFAGPQIEKVVQLIEPQKEIWVSCQIGGEDANRAYNESLSLQFVGNCDAHLMEKALAFLVQRHELLRSSISADGNNLCIFNEVNSNHQFNDLSNLNDVEQQKIINQYLIDNANKSFDLINGPLIRSELFKLNNEVSFLVITVHHIICDGWSFGILLQDLGKIYSAFINHQQPILNAPISFSHYAEQQVAFKKTSSYKSTEQYWINKLSNLSDSFELPINLDRPEIRTYKSERIDFPLDPDLVAQLSNLGAKHGISMITTLLACFEVFLYKLINTDQVIIGLPAAGQPVSGNHEMVGHCVNLLPIISNPKANISFVDYLMERKKAILDDLEHQQISFGALIQQLKINRQQSSIPLVPIVFNVDIDIDKGVGFEGLTYTLFSNPRTFENFEIFLNITGSNSAYIMEWSYNTTLFTAEKINQLIERFKILLSVIVLNPSALIKDIRSVDERSILDQLAIFNNTNAVYTTDKCVHQLFEEQVLLNANVTAITYNDFSYSYNQLNERVNQIAHLLIIKGIKNGDIVGVCLSRSVDMIAAVLAVYKTGAAYLAFDPEHPSKRINNILQLAEAKFVLTELVYTNLFYSLVTQINIQESIDLSVENPSIKVPTHSTSFVLFTSGSTGEPKGVLLTHKGLTNVILGLQKKIDFKSGNKLLLVTTIIFDLAQADIFLPLITGGEIILTTNDEAKDGNALLKLIKDRQIDYLEASPATYKYMLETGWVEKLPIKLTSCGEALSKDLAIELLKRCNELYNMYGPTETTIYATAAKINEIDEIAIGKPFQNTQIFILDKAGTLLPIGDVGEIFIAGDGVAKGYLNKPDLTKEKFVPCSYVNKAGALMFRTGDLGRFDKDGNIIYLGRKDNQVKIRGLRIELEEIEFHLRKLEGIKDAVVIVRNDIVAGQVSIVAYLINENLNSEQPQTDLIHQWRQSLSEVLPTYFIPNIFAQVKQFPLTASGKINRLAFEKPISSSNENSFEAPQSELQKQIAHIWCSALKVSSVGINDNFFDLGGHSLIAIEVMSKIKKLLGKQLPISSLFQHSTVRKLCILLGDNTQKVSFKSLVPINIGGTKPPLYVIHGHGLNIMVFYSFIRMMDTDQPVYGIQAKGLNGIDLPEDAIEEMAAEYLKEILADNPDGPYCVLGYSFGGLVAYEMTQQLIKLGKKVIMLGILDTNISNEKFYNKDTYQLFTKLKRQFPKLLFIANSFIKDPQATIHYQQLILVNKFNDLMIKFGLKKPVKQWGINHEDKVIDKLTFAFENYNIKPISVKVDLFRCKKRMYFIDDMISLGWNKYAKAGVNIIEVEGDHDSCLKPPLDKSFAATVQKVLNSKLL